MNELILCQNQNIIEMPYIFKSTNIKVYNIEEIYYHCYLYTEQSIYDILSDELNNYIKDILKLNSLYINLEKIKKQDTSIANKILSILSLINIFDKYELENIEKKIYSYENKEEWQKIRNKANVLYLKGEYKQSIIYYKKAIEYKEDNTIYNDLGVVYFKLFDYNNALYYFMLASNIKNELFTFLNIIDIYFIKKEYENAYKYIKIINDIYDDKIVYRYSGRYYYYIGEYNLASKNLIKSISLGDNNSKCILANVYIDMNLEDKARDIIDSIEDKDYEYYLVIMKFYKKYDVEKAYDIAKKLYKEKNEDIRHIIEYFDILNIMEKDIEKRYELLYKIKKHMYISGYANEDNRLY